MTALGARGAAEASRSDEAGARRLAWQIGLVTLAGAILFAGAILVRAGGHPLRFADIGTRFSQHDPEGTVGYDGQFYYFIARYGTDATPYIDKPSLRYMRILYPALARITAFGQPDLVPWALIGINGLAHGVGAALLTYLLAQGHGSPVCALLFAGWIGSLFSLRLDLTEPLCFALALGAVLAYRRERLAWAILLLVLSALSKELGLVFAGGLAFYAALGRGRWRAALGLWGVPLAVYLGWLLILRAWLDEFPARYDAAGLTLPFAGLLAVEDRLALLIVALWVALPAVLLVIAAAWRMGRTRQVGLNDALALALGGFTLTMPAASWVDPVAMLRLGTPLVIAALLFLGDHAPRRMRFLIVFWGPLSVLFFLIPELF